MEEPPQDLAPRPPASTPCIWVSALQGIHPPGILKEQCFLSSVTNFLANLLAPLMAALPWIGLTFATVFVAEMGDKTQLATVLMSAQGKSPWGIFLGSASALVVASVISVVLGEGLSSVLPPAVLELAAGIGFVGIGLWVLWRQWRGEADDVEA